MPAMRTRQKKIPRFPNQSKKSLIGRTNVPVTDCKVVNCTLGVGGVSTTVDSDSLIDSVLEAENHACCSDACAYAKSGGHYRETPAKCFRPYSPADCSSQF